MSLDRIISADSHVCEPPRLWQERLPAALRAQGPRTELCEDGEVFLCGNIRHPIAGMFAAGVPSEELPAFNRRGYDAAPAGVWDPAARLKDQDRDGVSAEVLYPSFSLWLFGLRDTALRAACFRAYNDFIAEYSSHCPSRLAGIGLVTLESVHEAALELERCAKLGLRGVLISAQPVAERPYSLREYDGFWATAQELGLPVSLHVLTGSDGTGVDPSSVLPSLVLLPAVVQRTLADMVFGGVFERFPRLRVVSVENDVSWLPHLMHRMDHIYDRFRFFDERARLSLKPSEVIQRNVHATFALEGEGIAFTAEACGYGNLMWSSDYPHTDSTWPNSRDCIRRGLQRIPTERATLLLQTNAERLYGLAQGTAA